MSEEKNIKPLWQASEQQINKSNLKAFVEYINKRYGSTLSITNYSSLHQWSVNHRELFWEACWQFFGIIHSKSYSSVLENGHDIKNSLWFSDAQFNCAQNLLELNLKNPEAIAIKEYNENGLFQFLSYEELRERTQAL